MDTTPAGQSCEGIFPLHMKEKGKGKRKQEKETGKEKGKGKGNRKRGKGKGKGRGNRKGKRKRKKEKEKKKNQPSCHVCITPGCHSHSRAQEGARLANWLRLDKKFEVLCDSHQILSPLQA